MFVQQYGAEILVRSKPITEIFHNNRTYVEGRRNSEYELKFLNRSGRRVLVIPSVDGLCVLDGKPCGVQSKGYVVNAYSQIVIPGWTVDSATTAHFIFKPQKERRKSDQTYVEAMGMDPTNQGTIGFMVFPEKPHSVDYDHHLHYQYFRNLVPQWSLPIACSADFGLKDVTRNSAQLGRGESANYMRASACSTQTQGLGTGFGKATDFATTGVSFFREDETRPDAVLVFYYDTLKGLEQQGVPVEGLRRKKPKSNPNPFPATPGLVQSGCRPPEGWHR